MTDAAALENLKVREALHPWSALPRESAGRYDRRRRIMDLQYYHQPSSLNAAFQTALVLTAQPIVELCLSIAPYVMNAGGVDRSLERAAFAGLIPDVVMQRRSKGDSSRYSARALECNRDWIGDALLNGQLVQRGLVRREPLEGLLVRGVVVDGRTKAALMNCVVVEAWLRRFKEVQTRAAESAGQSRPAGGDAPS
jgi:asparagine synthase (glutamine-hydrolysing)